MHGAAALLELGGVILGLGILGRLAGRLGLSAIPLYLLAGLAFGKGGLLPLVTASEFIEIGAEVGVILLLLLLGLEYSASELVGSLRTAAPAGLADLALNFTPGLLAGLLLGWSALAAVVLGGVTYVTSSGIVAIVRGDGAIPAPAPDARLEPGDTLVVVGTARGVKELAKLLGS